MSALPAFARNDLRAVAREPFLLLMLVAPLLLIALQRFAAPPLADAIGRAGLDVSGDLPLLPGFLLCMLVPQLLGAMAGLMLLDDRDAGTLLAVRVTPVALGPFVAYRVTLAAAVSAVAVGTGIPLTGLAAPPIAALLGVSVLAGLLAPFTALLLSAFASNKVEGLAALKAAGLPLVAPVGAWFIDGPWGLAFGVVPTYWPAAALWAAETGDPAWPYLIVGALYLGALIWWLWYRLRDRVERV